MRIELYPNNPEYPNEKTVFENHSPGYIKITEPEPVVIYQIDQLIKVLELLKTSRSNQSE